MSVRTLRIASTLYLLLPVILFVYFWFHIFYAIPLFLGYLYFVRRLFYDQSDKTERFNRDELIYISILALIWVLASGVGGVSVQVFDHWGHNAKYNDLTINTWPIFFFEKGQYAVYYFAYYLVPAFLSKHILGYPSAILLFIWTALGFFIGLFWAYLLIGRNKFIFLAFPCIGGFSFFLKYLVWQHISQSLWGSPNLSGFQSLLVQSQWVFNQMVPTLIICGLLLYNWQRNKLVETFFGITLLFVWAVFPAIVILLLYVSLLLRSIEFKAYFASFVSLLPLHFLAGILFLPTFIYLISSNGGIHGFIWQFEKFPDLLPKYIVGVVVELAVLWLLYLLIKDYLKGLFSEWLVGSAFVILILLSQYRVGYYNDWFMRGTTPMVVILAIVILRGFSERWNQLPARLSYLRYVIPIALLVNSPNALSQIGRSFYKNILVVHVLQKPVFVPIPMDRYPNTYQMLLHKYTRAEANQYLGRKNSIYERYLAKPPQEVTSVSERRNQPGSL